MEDRVRAQIGSWRDNLINLSRSNRLLYFKKTKTSTRNITQPGIRELLGDIESKRGATFWEPPDELDEPSQPMGGEPSAAEPKGRLRAGRQPKATEVVTDTTSRSQLRRSLGSLERRSNQEFLDRGLWVLWLALGSLEWVEPPLETGPSQTVSSPLILVPVKLSHSGNDGPFSLSRTEEDVTVNPALAYKLHQDFDLVLPDLEYEDIDDLDGFFTQLEQIVKGKKGWGVHRTAWLSTFSFHKEVMFQDLKKNETQIAGHPVVKALALGHRAAEGLDFSEVPEHELDHKHPPESVLTILDADSSQRQCLAAAAQGHSFIIEGPPGTGKSQTIANLIADALGRNHTVLFVSEKAAALEVVQTRLKRAQLGDYTLELHSHKATRKEVARDLGQSLHVRVTQREQFGAEESSQLVKQREELNAYAVAINEARLPLNMSVYQVLGRLAALQDVPNVPTPSSAVEGLSAASLGEITDACEALARAWEPVSRGDGFLWRVRDTELTQNRRVHLVDAIAAQEALLVGLRQTAVELATRSGLAWQDGVRDAERFRTLLDLFQNPRLVPARWLLDPGLLPKVRKLLSARKRAATTLQCSLAELSRDCGSGWEQLNAADLPLLERDWSELKELRLGTLCDRLTDSHSGVDLEAQLRRLSAHLQTVIALSSEIATTFANESPVTQHGARTWCGLAHLALATHKPDSFLFDSVNLASAKVATRSLEPIVVQQNQRLNRIRQLFKESVFDVDCQALGLRFTEIHRGLGKLRPAYWRDRRLLREHAKSGRVRAQELTGLMEVVSFQEAHGELKTLEAIHAAALGPRLYGSLDTDFDVIRAALDTVNQALAQGSGLTTPETLGRCLSEQSTSLSGLAALGQQLKPKLDELPSLAASFGDEMSALLESIPLPELLATTDGFSRLLSGLTAPWQRVSVLSANAGITFDTVIRCLAHKRTVDDTRAGFAATWTKDVSLIGPQWQGESTDYWAVGMDLDWATQVVTTLGDTKLSCEAPVLTHLARDFLPLLVQNLTEWSSRTHELLDEFVDSEREPLSSELAGSFDHAGTLLENLRLTVTDIVEWGAFVTARSRLDRLGCREQATFCIKQEVPADTVTPTILRSVLAGWIDAHCNSDSRLGVFRSVDRDHLVERFKDLDRRFVELAGGRVMDTCNKRRPTTSAGAVALIATEGNKQRRHMPIRKLMDAAGHVIQALKPCFMMSPLTVSQFLPPTMNFDLVIFDEASQVRPADAINCIYRGNQLIIAGDQKQLPPTPFFDRMGADLDEEWDEEQVEAYESVLDVAKGAGTLKAMRLLWHYRSQHEDLITYSNYSFYDGRLVTFPGATPTAPDLGVEFFPVKGVYRRGGARDNPIEAAAVVERVLHHVRAHPGLTVGVIAFSEAQASTIEREIERRSVDHPELRVMLDGDRLTGGFVKNLETVQGDERDIIIFSIGYGPDEAGRLTMNFGPLNKTGGERRLNVAITRARRKVEVVSSIRYTDFAGDLGSEGGRHLKRYLEFAERADNRMAAVLGDLGDGNRDAESPFEEEVLRAVRSWGYAVTPQVGCADYRIDMAVKHPTEPGRYVLGIECDGAMYHSSRVARDRDRLRQEVLARLGWTHLHRIWGLSWYRNRGAEEIRLRRVIEDAARSEGGRSGAEVHTPILVDVGTVELNETPAWVNEYRMAVPAQPQSSVEMHEWAAESDLQRMILEVVAVEGPVSKEVVLRRVREQFGADRTGTRIRTAFDSAIKLLRRLGLLEVHERTFLRKPGQTESPVRGGNRSVPETVRRIEDVPKSELQTAIQRLVQDVHPISEDELSQRVAAIFGWTRRGPDIAEALRTTIRGLVVKKMLRRTDLGLQPNSQ